MHVHVQITSDGCLHLFAADISPWIRHRDSVSPGGHTRHLHRLGMYICPTHARGRHEGACDRGECCLRRGYYCQWEGCPHRVGVHCTVMMTLAVWHVVVVCDMRSASSVPLDWKWIGVSVHRHRYSPAPRRHVSILAF
jgi:hypothetical protein